MAKLRRLFGHEVVAILRQTVGSLLKINCTHIFITPEQRQRYSSMRAYDTTPPAPIP